MPDHGTIDLLRGLNDAASSGDWGRLEELSEMLPGLPPPQNEAAMNEYLFALRASVVSARTVRADIVKSLHRLTAASRFNQCG